MKSIFSDLAELRMSSGDVVVGHTEALLQGPLGTRFRGGPCWPDFYKHVLDRHCRGMTPFPVDQKPTTDHPPVATLENGVWCGPIIDHYGHQISDFGMRIAYSIKFSGERPLLFSLRRNARQNPEAHVPPFFWQIVDHFGVPRSRVALLAEPALVRDLTVFPQAERHHGAGPSEKHLDFMDALFPAPAEQDLDAVYVSRSKLTKGGIAGERHLDEAMRAAGVTVIWPERLPIARQLEIYRRAKAIIFAEGSAVHTLQLVGRVNSRIAVICRRPKKRIAEQSLAPRARAVTYVDGVKTLIHGLKPRSGVPERPHGMTVLDSDLVFELISEFLSKPISSFDRKGYEAEQLNDLRKWKSERDLRPSRHPDDDAFVAEMLERAGVDL